MKQREQGRAAAAEYARRPAARRSGRRPQRRWPPTGRSFSICRSADAFAEGHPYGALNLAFGPKVGYWAGWVVPPDVPLLLLADEPAQAQEAVVQLLRVGLDRVEGTIAGGSTAGSAPACRWRRSSRCRRPELRDAVAGARTRCASWTCARARVVRRPSSKAPINIPVGELPARDARAGGRRRRSPPSAKAAIVRAWPRACSRTRASRG